MVNKVRFNDQLRTVLAANIESPGAAITVWRQCVDLLAQSDREGASQLLPDDVDALLGRLDSLRARVDLQQRMATIVELGSRLRSPKLMQFLADDVPAISAAAASRAQISDTAWPRVIARIGPIARNALRNRRDMGPLAVRALETFRAADMLLRDERVVDAALIASEAGLVAEPLIGVPDPAGVEAEPVAEPEVAEDSQIRRIVERIEQFTINRRDGVLQEPIAPLLANGTAIEPTVETVEPDGAEDGFRFETDVHGVIVAVEGAPRAAVIGLSIGEAAGSVDHGPDGHAIGAFKRRGAFRHARFTIGSGSLAGAWLITAIPRFDPASGRFTGYDGVARRPSRLEATPRLNSARAHETLPPSSVSMRQLVHELRTPLNAIIGFADIIAGQLFGPASEQYRAMASQISTDATSLLTVFEDLDLASRLDHMPVARQPEAIDAGALAERVIADYAEATERKQASVAFDWPAELPSVSADPVQTERLIQHFIRTMLSVTNQQERLSARLIDAGQTVDLIVDRPSALVGKDEHGLLDPDYSPEGEWPDASLLGIGFAFRLIDGLAKSIGGRFDIQQEAFRLRLPAENRNGSGAGKRA